MPINIGSDRVEKQLPGTQKRHAEYNAMMKEIAEKYGQEFLSVDDLNPEVHYPDGVHYSPKGHEIIARRLMSIIEGRNSK